MHRSLRKKLKLLPRKKRMQPLQRSRRKKLKLRRSKLTRSE